MSADATAAAEAPENELATTDDALLGGRLIVRQPARGFRVAIDTLLVAAAVPAAAGDTVLEAGAGVAAAGLCLASRVPGVRVVGVERERPLVRLARHNALANGLADRVETLEGDIVRPPARLAPGTFDHALANPPYVGAGGGTPPPVPVKARATHERDTTLGDWVRFLSVMLRKGGSVTLIQRADRLAEVLAALAGPFGGIAVYPLWPGPVDDIAPPRPAQRILVRGLKGSRAPLALLPGLVLHRPGGAYTPEAEAVLRDAGALDVGPRGG